MKTQFTLTALALLSAFSLQPLAFGQGTLTPPGAPAPTMKSLDQIEARTPISSVPFTITSSGSYYLTTNVVCTVSNAIVITANGVTLDLNGFTISSTMPDAASGGAAIFLVGTATAALSDITILNGHIRGGVTNNAGTYAGSGFADGIVYSGNAPVNVLVSHVSVSGCLYLGIFLELNNSTVVESCTVRTVGSIGIGAAIIRQSSAFDCGGSAIYGSQVSDCRGVSPGSGDGVIASTAQNCGGRSNSGTGVSAATAQNCSGSSNSGTGVSAGNALNCDGNSSTGIGLSAGIAVGCSASSFSTAHQYFCGSGPAVYP